MTAVLTGSWGGAAGQYGLKPGVFLSQQDDEGLLLDVVADQYLSLDPTATAIWSRLAAGATPIEAANSLEAILAMEGPAAKQEVELQLAAWHECGLVLPRAGALKTPRSKVSGTAASSALPASEVAAASASWASYWRMLKAGRWARRALKERGLADALCELQQVPRQNTSRGDRNYVYCTVKAFRSLRSTYRQGQDDCLTRSLELAYALTSQSIEVDVCFGVRKFPFNAHAWVERNGCVLSDYTLKLDHLAVVARF